MSRIALGGLGPDRSTLAAAIAGDDGVMVVGLQLLGIRFSIEPVTAREIAKGIVDVCDAIETPGGLYGLPAIDADLADAAAITAALATAKTKARQ